MRLISIRRARVIDRLKVGGIITTISTRKYSWSIPTRLILIQADLAVPRYSRHARPPLAAFRWKWASVWCSPATVTVSSCRLGWMDAAAHIVQAKARFRTGRTNRGDLRLKIYRPTTKSMVRFRSSSHSYQLTAETCSYAQDAPLAITRNLTSLVKATTNGIQISLSHKYQ